MSYAFEELRIGVIELFSDAARLGQGREFGVLRLAFFKDRPITDEALLEEAKRAKPLPRIHPPLRTARARIPHPLGRGTNSILGWQRRVDTLAREGRCVCICCGSTSPTHRCPG